jgi:hypothetical protein
MSRWRLVAGVGVVAALALTLIVLSVRGNAPSNSSTTTLAADPSTTTTTASTTTTAATTVTTTAEQRLAEVEALLQDLWFGWFDAIYRKDPDALWDVVATTTFYDAGVAAMETMTFESKPAQSDISFASFEILLDRPDCLVVSQNVDVSVFRGSGTFIQNVSVLWPDNRYGFRFATDWVHPGDLWLQDCDNLEREITP